MSKNSNTENDLVIQNNRNVSKAQIDSFNLSNYLIKLIGHEPFYSRILRSLNKVETTQIATAGVSTTYDKITLYWNREFLASLPDRQVIGVLKHECLHLLYDHTTSRRREPHIIWNYATDLSINTLLSADELPEGGLIPGRHLPAPKGDDVSQKTLERYEKISKLIASFPPNKSADWYFERLMEDPEIQDMLQDQQAMQQELQDLLDSMDNHDDWGNMSDEEREQVRQKIQNIFKEANVECQKRNSWGSIPQSVIRDIRSLYHREIKWQDVLRRFVGFSTRNERTSTVTRLNRKYPGVHPGIQKDHKPKILVYVDESGSVDDTSLENFFGELNSLATICEFTLFKFDSEVDESTKTDFKKGRRMNLKRQCSGGTNFDAPTQHANKLKNEYDGFIIMTDGGAEKPSISRLKRCWVLCPNTQLHFGNNNIDKNDFLVSMK